MSRPTKITKELLTRSVMFLVYLTCGALIFMSTENTSYSQFHDNINDTSKQISDALLILRSTTRKCVPNMTDEEMGKFSKDVQKIREVIINQPEEWKFTRGIRLCFEIMSTIGYGSTPPKTQAGRLIAVLFALFGIPIFILMLKTVGEMINRQLIKSIYFVEKRFFQREEPDNIELKVMIGFTFLLVLDVLIESLFLMCSHNDFTFIDGLYATIITATTVGFGDIMLENQMTMIISLVLLSTVLDGASCYAQKKIEEERKKRRCTCFGRGKRETTSTEDGHEGQRDLTNGEKGDAVEIEENRNTDDKATKLNKETCKV